jgi:hypothetical protein
MSDLREVDAERRAAVAADIVHIANLGRRRSRDRALTPREALIALEFEALVVSVAALNLAKGKELTDDDRDRLMLAYQRIDVISDEAAR